jgi:meso-butanediol dehydrogenase / (S,S)-butanediol dehydrogenase / diacetyl reductase
MSGKLFAAAVTADGMASKVPSPKSGRLTGKIAFITGVASGMGRAAARLFAAQGATVVGCDLNESAAEQTAAEIRDAGGRMFIFAPVDVASATEADKWICNGVDETGGIDILYNNAGGARFGSFDGFRQEDWSFTLRNELDLVFYTTQAAWPHFIARGGGSVLNTGSAVAARGNPTLGFAAHAAAKGGVLALTRQLAAEGAKHQIRVNTISPGPIRTPAITTMPPEMVKRIESVIPLGRWGECEEIAYCALYLASDEARWVTGADFVIDGGGIAGL